MAAWRVYSVVFLNSIFFSSLSYQQRIVLVLSRASALRIWIEAEARKAAGLVLKGRGEGAETPGAREEEEGPDG